MIDFLFLYEHKARELENCVYLATALKKKGYKVRIASMLSFEKKIYKPKVIITPHLYDEQQLKYYTSSVWKGRAPKIISMQYEQVLNEEGRKTKIHRPKGEAKGAYHVAWGENEREEYKDNGIKENHILKVGSISMDFNTSHYRKYLYSKHDFALKYGIPENKVWHTFFSSFSLCGRSDENLNRRPFKEYAFKLRQLMEESQPVILEWFEREMQDKPQAVYIYRKHPAEKLGCHLVELSKKYPGQFYCIDDYSVRHWIHVSDVCLTWFSTTSIDAHFAEKPCLILRPFPLDRGYEVETLYNVHTIQTYDEYHDVLNQDIEIQDVFRKNIEHFFYNEINHLVLNNYVEAFIDVVNNHDDGTIFVPARDTFRNRLVEDLLGILCDICKYIKIAKFVSFFSSKIGSSLEYYQREVYGVSSEIKQLSGPISQFIEDHYSKK